LVQLISWGCSQKMPPSWSFWPAYHVKNAFFALFRVQNGERRLWLTEPRKLLIWMFVVLRNGLKHNRSTESHPKRSILNGCSVSHRPKRQYFLRFLTNGERKLLLITPRKLLMRMFLLLWNCMRVSWSFHLTLEQKKAIFAMIWSKKRGAATSEDWAMKAIKWRLDLLCHCRKYKYSTGNNLEKALLSPRWGLETSKSWAKSRNFAVAVDGDIREMFQWMTLSKDSSFFAIVCLTIEPLATRPHNTFFNLLVVVGNHRKRHFGSLFEQF